MQRLTISVVIPAFNEEQTIQRVLRDVFSLDRIPDRVVVVDNASDDQTAALAKEAGAIVVAESQRGYGAACLKGLEYLNQTGQMSAESVVVFLDADYSDFPEDMLSLVQPIIDGRAEFVVGSRLQDHEARKAVPPVSRFGNSFACWWIRLLYGVRYTDMGPFRAITWGALQKLEMKDRTWGWTLEMQLKACEYRLRALEIPVRYRARGGGKSKISQSFSGAIRASIKILWVLGKHVLERATSLPKALLRTRLLRFNSQ